MSRAFRGLNQNIHLIEKEAGKGGGLAADRIDHVLRVIVRIVDEFSRVTQLIGG